MQQNPQLLQLIAEMVGSAGAGGPPNTSSRAPNVTVMPKNVPPNFAPPQPFRLAPPGAELPAQPPAPSPAPDPAPAPAMAGAGHNDLIGRLRDMMEPEQPAAPSNGIGSFIGDAAAGMAGGRPSAPPASAFVAGLSGAMSSAAQRRKDTTDAALAAEDRRLAREDKLYERGRDARGDARLDAEELRKDAKARADARAADLAAVKATQEVMAGLNPDLFNKRDKIEGHVEKRVKDLVDAAVGNRDIPPSPDEYQQIVDAAIKEGNAFRLDLEKRLLPGTAPAPGTPAPAPGGGAEVPMSKAQPPSGVPVAKTLKEAMALGPGAKFWDPFAGIVRTVPK
jgi:hypothetical protein